jgi:hypothetical protein
MAVDRGKRERERERERMGGGTTKTEEQKIYNVERLFVTSCSYAH